MFFYQTGIHLIERHLRCGLGLAVITEYTAGHADVLWSFSVSIPESGSICLQTNLKINGKALTLRREESLMVKD